MKVPSAYLRVFVPAGEVGAAEFDALDDPPARDPRRWQELSGGDLGVLVESRPIPGWRMEGPEGPLVCPARSRLRTLAGMLSIRDQFPDQLAAGFLSEQLVGEAAEELEGLRFKGDLKTYVLESTWHIPLRWFLAFEPGERRFSDAKRSVQYEADLSEAIKRVRDSAEVARSAGLADEVVNLVDDLAGWLDDFPTTGSRVVLDYGDLAALFEPAELAMDDSVEEMRGAVAALERGDWDESGRLYFAVNERWMALRAFENAS